MHHRPAQCQRMMMNYISAYRFSAISVLLATIAGCQRPSAPDLSLGTPTVSVSKPIERKVGVFEEFTGRVNAVESVDVRARITGYIVEVKFRDGDFVKENQVLYKIDDTTYKADLERTQGDVKRLQAQADLLVIQVARYKGLVAQKAASQQDLDEYLGKQAENAGSLISAKASLAIAEANLKWTNVTSPISGRVSKTNLTKGNLVTANTTQLTTIVSYDPIYISFNMEEPLLIRIQRLMRQGKIKVDKLPQVEIDAGLSDDAEHKFPFHGKWNFADN